MLNDRVDVFRPCLQFFSHVGTFSCDETGLCCNETEFVQGHNTGLDLSRNCLRLNDCLFVCLFVCFFKMLIPEKKRCRHSNIYFTIIISLSKILLIIFHWVKYSFWPNFVITCLAGNYYKMLVAFFKIIFSQKFSIRVSSILDAGSEVRKLFASSTQLSRNILLIIVKMSTIVGILTFISMINATSEGLRARYLFICRYFSFMSNGNFVLSWV